MTRELRNDEGYKGLKEEEPSSVFSPCKELRRLRLRLNGHPKEIVDSALEEMYRPTEKQGAPFSERLVEYLLHTGFGLLCVFMLYCVVAGNLSQ